MTIFKREISKFGIMKQKKKQKRRNKSDWGDDFIAPDGGWGWLVCFAGGLSNLSILPIWQSFGLVFRDRLIEIGLTNSQITTIINAQPAVLSCTGLFNGPIFRRFSCRQTALTAALFVAIGIFLASIANSFMGYFISYSILFGIGMRLSLTTTFLTINTYFNVKRRRANSFALTVSGFGHIFWPHIVNILLLYYGVQGATMILSAISLNAFAFGLIYQPVNWHTKKTHLNTHSDSKLNIEICSDCHLAKTDKNVNNHSSDVCGDTATTSHQHNNNSKSQKTQNDPSDKNLYQISNNNITICNCDTNPNSILLDVNNKTENIIINDMEKSATAISQMTDEKLKWHQKLMKFFDLDLLKDMSYVNIMIGLTLSAFSEQNFTSLTPFFLSDFGFSKNEIAMAMSLLGCGELAVRFLIPFVTDHVHWSSQIFFIIGISGMTIGRVFIAQIPTFNVLLVIFGLMGICRALRTVFMGLVIPDYVPLNRLPAATGLQLLATGIFTISFGPLVGYIQDTTNSSFMLYFLSFISMTNVLLWILEMIYRSIRKSRKS